MNEKVNGLAVIILPASISQEETKQVFDAVLSKFGTEFGTQLNSNEGCMVTFDRNDLFGHIVPVPTREIVILAENLLHEFENKLQDPVAFATSFVCEYYGPRDLINHGVITTFANVKEGSVDWNYLSTKGLTFLVYQCRNILSNQR